MTARRVRGLVLSVPVLASVMVATTAHATGGGSGHGSAAVRTATIQARLTVYPREHAMRITPPAREVTTAEPTGGPGDGRTKRQERANFACIEAGAAGGEKFVIYPPVTIPASRFGAGDTIAGAYLWHNYGITDFRETAAGMTDAFKSCTVGAWLTNHGWRQLSSGVTLTMATRPAPDVPLLVGSSPGARDGEVVSSGSIAVDAASRAPGTRVDFPANTGGSYRGGTGSYRPELGDANPFRTNHRNNVNAWWQEDALGLGATDPVAETSTAVWELGPGEDPVASLDVYWGSGLTRYCLFVCD